VSQDLPPGFLEAYKDALRLEAVVTCVGFDDLLDVCLRANMPHVDTMVVVTAEDDHRTRHVAEQHGAVVVRSHLFKKDEKQFNKGAAMTQGLQSCRFKGSWKLLLDADIILPLSFRRVLFNHTHLDPFSIYGADRINVIGLEEADRMLSWNQHQHGYVVLPKGARPIEKRIAHPLYGYVPVGYFQLFNGDAKYPFTKGTAEYDDVLFAAQWPESQRRLLPTAVVYHFCTHEPTYMENWDGHRREPRLDSPHMAELKDVDRPS